MHVNTHVPTHINTSNILFGAQASATMPFDGHGVPMNEHMIISSALMIWVVMSVILITQLNSETWIARMPDFVLGVLSKACDFEGRQTSTISEWLNGDKV